ncbi:hypothetical protein BLOT_006485 [Blomia tropicalis]|nr:hypothetical protein BLOT_006485 [Blomia tropicalis]
MCKCKCVVAEMRCNRATLAMENFVLGSTDFNGILPFSFCKLGLHQQISGDNDDERTNERKNERITRARPSNQPVQKAQTSQKENCE